jgi:cold shock CspA family protein
MSAPQPEEKAYKRMASHEPVHGIVARLRQGFGFISSSGTDYFFHASVVVGSFSALREGQHVEFTVEPSDRGPRAGFVRPLD